MFVFTCLVYLTITKICNTVIFYDIRYICYGHWYNYSFTIYIIGNILFTIVFYCLAACNGIDKI